MKETWPCSRSHWSTQAPVGKKSANLGIHTKGNTKINVEHKSTKLLFKKERENLQGVGKEFLDWAIKNTFRKRRSDKLKFVTSAHSTPRETLVRSAEVRAGGSAFAGRVSDEVC